MVFVVLYCLQLFCWFSYELSEKYWAISPKGKHKLSETKLSTFQKCLFELRYAFFFGCLWKNCFENFLRSLYLEQYVFLFKCRVTFRQRHFLKATYGTLALYILRLRCLVISNTYKNSFCFLSKTETFQNDVEYVPKMSFWTLLGLFFWLQIKKMFWELPQVSLLETIRVFRSNAELSFGCPSSRRLRLVLWLFTSCVWAVLRYRILIETAFDFFGNVAFVILYCVQLFWWFSYKPPEKYWATSPKGKHKLSKTTLSTFQKCLFELCSDFLFGCLWKNCFENFLRSLYLEQYVFLFKCRVTFRQRHFLKATYGTLALYILRLRCLVISNTYKNSFCFLSKTGTFQNDVEYVPKMSFWALLGLFFWLQIKKMFWCFENFLRSLYLKQYVFFVQMQS